MRFSHLAKLFYEWGWQIKHDQYVNFCDYLQFMLRKNRVILIEKDGRVDGVILFYLTNDYTKLYKKQTWSTINDEENGHQIYIDKMVCRKYTRELRDAIKSAIEERFPNVEIGIYHRAPKDRSHIVYRRRAYVV